MTKRTLTKDSIVTAWLIAEIDSPRFRHLLTQEQSEKEVREIIQNGSPEARYELLLQARPGVQRFPWHLVAWEESEIIDRASLGQMRTCPGLNWLAFTDGTRLLSDAAAWIQKQHHRLNPHLHVKQTQQTIGRRAQIPPIIAYLPSGDAPAPVLLEGHVRAVSYFTSPATTYPLPIYLGRATSEHFLSFDNGLNFSEIRQAFTKGEV